jgi:hypothetical protein
MLATIGRYRNTPIWSRSVNFGLGSRDFGVLDEHVVADELVAQVDRFAMSGLTWCW